jgi:hypothetical protein
VRAAGHCRPGGKHEGAYSEPGMGTRPTVARGGLLPGRGSGSARLGLITLMLRVQRVGPTSTTTRSRSGNGPEGLRPVAADARRPPGAFHPRAARQARPEGAPSHDGTGQHEHGEHAEHRARGSRRGRHGFPDRLPDPAEPDPARGLRRAGPPRDRHRARPRDGRRPEGRQRPPRDGDEHGPDGLPALPEVAPPRPQRPELGRPRPVRPVHGALEPDAVRAALPLRLRPGARRPEGAADVGVADPRPPGGQPHPRRRDDDRPAGPGRRQRRRHGDGRAPRARAVRPRRPRGPEPVRPHHLGVLLRR